MKTMRVKNKKLAEQGLRGLAVLLVLMLAHAASAASPPKSAAAVAQGKFAKYLNYKDGNGLVDVIVQYRVTPTTAHYSKMASRGATVKSKLHSIHAAAFRIPASAIPLLEQDPDILYVTPDRPVKLSSVMYEPYESAVTADAAAQQYALDGTGVGIALIDSGVADHPDLHDSAGASRVIYNQSFVAGNASAVDAYGHGTHIAGILAGSGAAPGLPATGGSG